MQPRAIVLRGGGLGGGLGPRALAPRGSLLGGQTLPQRSVCAAAGRANTTGGSSSSELEWWKKRPGEDGWRPGDDDDSDGGYNSGYARGSQGRQQRRDSGYGRGGGRQRQQRRPLHPWERGGGGREEEEDEEEGPGWWEVPRAEREAMERAAGPQPLEGWQEQRLVVAFARGRRRVSVQQLAADLGLDRTEVTDWFKRHAARPKTERDALEAPLSDQIAKEVAADEERRERERQKKAAKAGGGDGAAAAAAGAKQPAPAPLGALLTPTKGPDTGYIPFAQRGRGGPGAPKRLAADALRTLESLYARSPYPSKDLLQSICDMHRLPRDVASEWFTQRREAEGRPHDPKAAKRLADQAARTAAAAAGDIPASAAGGKRRGGAGAVPRGPLPGEEDELMRLMRAAAAEAAAAAASEAAGAAQRRQRGGGAAAAAGGWGDVPFGAEEGEGAGAGAAVRRVVVSAREMASLRSSLPSPKKLKGIKLAEQLDIRRDSNSSVVIGGVEYVVRSGAAQWRRAWTRRRSSRAAGGVPAKRLDFVQWYNTVAGGGDE